MVVECFFWVWWPLVLPSETYHLVPWRDPSGMTYGAHEGFPAGSRRFLSVGTQRDPSGINYPRGSHEIPMRVPRVLPTWFPCGSQVVPTLCFTQHQLPMWFPRGSLQFTIWLPCGSQVVPHTDRWINVIQYSSKPSTFWLQQWKIFHKVQTMTSAYSPNFIRSHHSKCDQTKK